MLAERPRRTKKARNEGRGMLADISHMPGMTLSELERRLEELPIVDDELPSSSGTAQPENVNTTTDVTEHAEAAENEKKTAKNEAKTASTKEAEMMEVEKPTGEAKATCSISENLFPVAEISLKDEKELEENLKEMRIETVPSIYPGQELTHLADSTDVVVQMPAAPIAIKPESKNAVREDIAAASLSNSTATAKVAESRVYPTLAAPMEKNEHGLLTENQLLTFYRNELYEAVDDFVEEFLQHEEFPHHDLCGYLQRYKTACENLLSAEVDVQDCERLVKECASSTWTAETRTVKQEGRCGDQRYATGSATYTLATFHPDCMAEMKKLLRRDVTGRLDNVLSLQAEMRSLALQIQWLIVDYNNAFMSEYHLNTSSPPCFFVETMASVNRKKLRCSLSDLFHSIRSPNLPSRFIESVTGWISELVAVLLKACTADDQLYILCHLLRLISPVAQWAAPLLQSFINIETTNERLIIDHSVAMLSILLSPVRGRENFLRRVTDYERDENSWTVIGEDGEEAISIASIGEADLVAFLNQFGTEALFARAIKHFTAFNRSNMISQVLSIFAFELVLLKSFNDGLHVYSRPRFVQFCKQIGHAMRRSIRCLSEYFKSVKDLFSVDELILIQNEYDRIILHAVYYIVGKQSLGLWQFLVDLPFDSVSEQCRLRCQILLRRKTLMTVAQLYDIEETHLPHLVSTAGSLMDRLPDLPSNDAHFMVSALSSIIAVSEADVEPFILELFDACFLDVSMRDHFYKVGSEAIAIVIDKQPQILHRLLLLLDRNMDSLEEHAVEVLVNAPISKCRLSEDDVGVICGKWLINRHVSHPASRIARRVLGSMNWGTDAEGNLWLPLSVHIVCANTLIKGHVTHCKTTNGLISKSWNKVAKLASKVPDYEHQFDVFCWDILVRLKLTSERNSLSCPSVNDLASFYVFVILRSLISIDEFIASGLSLWSDLINAGCYAASVIILSHIVSFFASSVTVLTTKQIFGESVDHLLQYDQSSYAVQLLVGSSKFPGSAIRLLNSAITYHLEDDFSKEQLHAWVQVLCCKRPTAWNNDRCTLYLLNAVVKIAFIRDPSRLVGLVEVFQDLYSTVIQQWKESAKGVLSWFTSEGGVPPLISSSNYMIAPWATFALLLAEQQSFAGFYDALYLCMSKHPKNTLEQSIKKASSKLQIPLPVNRLHYYRWMEFACAPRVCEHAVFPLILQQLAIHIYSRKTYSASKVCYGDRYLNCGTSRTLLEDFRNKLLPQVDHSANNISILCKAFIQWLSNPSLCNPKSYTLSGLLCDHLLHFIFAGELQPWTEYVDMPKLRTEISEDKKLYIFARHLGCFVTNPSAAPIFSITELVAKYSAENYSQPFPTVPLHPDLPRKTVLDITDACNERRCLELYSNHLRKIVELARMFVNRKDRLEDLDLKYVEQYPKLYASSSTTLTIVLSCASTLTGKCSRPVNSSVTVTASHYQPAVEAVMKDNRQKRSNQIADVYSQLFSATSFHCAHLENIATTLCHYRKGAGGVRVDQLQCAGRMLFFHTVSSVTSLDMIFPATSKSVSIVLSKLGEAFIANQATEQLNLMQVVLNGSHLIHLLAPHFTPHCVPSSELLALYKSLSQAVRNPSTSAAALTLLSQLDIKNTSDKLPSQQFSQLMPVAFENLISIVDTTSPFFEMCAKHFIHSVFFRFPDNFLYGLNLALSGCDTGSTPVFVFDKINATLGANLTNMPNFKPEVIIDSRTALDAATAIALRLNKSRRELSVALYKTWSKYLSNVSLLAEFFLFEAVSRTFDPQNSMPKLEEELGEIFSKSTQVFGPLLEPCGVNFPPWSLSDMDVAAVVLDRFVSLMSRLHMLYDAYFPPGFENLVTLLWRYYAAKFPMLNESGSHVHKIIESRFINLPWHLFWPCLLDLASMEKVMSEGAKESAPFVTQVFVRIGWLSLIHHQTNQPEDAQRAFYSLLFSILSHCVSSPTNYTVCRATMPKLIKSLAPLPWHLIDVDRLDSMSLRIISILPANVLSEPVDVTSSFFDLFAHVCFFGYPPMFSVPIAEMCRKQSFYVRTTLALMVKNSKDREWMFRTYEEEIKIVDRVLRDYDQVNEYQAALSKELTSFWSLIIDSKFLDGLQKALIEWIKNNPKSPLILLFLKTVMSSLKSSQADLGIKIVDACIHAYFNRVDNCDWQVVLAWLSFPENCRRTLFVLPHSENGAVPSFLGLSGHVMKSMQTGLTESQESQLLTTLLNYIMKLKAKYVIDEAAFLLLVDQLQKLLLREFRYKIQQANEHVMQYLEWLRHVRSDDKGSVFSIFSRKQPFPIKIRYICHVMELYISQQTVSPDRPPRDNPNTPVFNSRVDTFKELCSAKNYSSFQKTSQIALPYFTRAGTYHFAHTPELFAHLLHSLYNEKYVLVSY